HFLLIEPDAALRRIVIEEMRQVLTLPINVAEVVFPRVGELPSRPHEGTFAGSPEDTVVAARSGVSNSGSGGNSGTGCTSATDLAGLAEGAIAVVLPSKAEMVRQLLRPETDLVVLQIQSIRSSLAEYLPARVDTLIAVASGWADFLTLAHTMLIAAGFDADSIVLRDRSEAGWRNGLDEVAAVICDSVTARELAAGRRGLANEKKRPAVIAFRLLAESSLEELRRCEELILQSHLSVSSEAEFARPPLQTQDHNCLIPRRPRGL
ncbi:MAG TPA: hypothetical protein VGD64_11410, partial [Acidisarcina sp.]